MKGENKIKSFNWKKLFVALICFLLINFFESSLAYAQDDSNPKKILEKMEKAYLKLSSYQDSGVVIRVITSEPQKMSTTTPFSLSFKRPNLLRFEWTDTMFGGQKDRHVLWSDGKETYTYWESLNQYEKESSLDMGIAGATGISQGSAYTVPTMLFGDVSGFRLTMLSDVILLRQENFEGTQCYVITGKHSMGYEHKLWIGIDDYLLRKLEVSVKSIKKAMKMIEQVRKEAAIDIEIPDMSKLEDFSSVTKEIHRDIKVDIEISKDMFKFIPPEGTKLVED